MMPRRSVSLAPRTRVEASAVSPLAMMKVRRLSMWPPVWPVDAIKDRGGEKAYKILGGCPVVDLN
jgi:hypothetical protein